MSDGPVYQYQDVQYCEDGYTYPDVECPGFEVPAGTWPSLGAYFEFCERLAAEHRPSCPCAGRRDRV